MVSAQEIRSKVAEWLDGKISLAAFQDWFVPATWDSYRAEDQAAQKLASQIDLSLAEYSGGYLPLDALKSDLRSFCALPEERRDLNGPIRFVIARRTPIFERPMRELKEALAITASVNGPFVISVQV